MTTDTREEGWIVGRRFDLAFFFGPSLLAALLGAALLLRPGWTAAAWWIFTLVADGPHLFLTITRTYLDPADRRRLGLRLAIMPLWLLLGPLSLVATRASGSRGPWDLFLLFATLWSYWHTVRQHYGLLALYERHAGADRRVARLDGLFVQGTLWAMSTVYMLVIPANRRILSLPDAPSPREHTFVLALLALIGVASLAWLLASFIRARRGARMRPVWFALGPVLALYVWNLFVVGAREPLLAHPASTEQIFLAVTTIGGLTHSLQYMGLVAAANRRRYGRSPLRLYAIIAALSLVGYALLNGARGAPGVAFFGMESDAARLFLGLYWGLFFMHYHLDQVIWHPSRDPALRAELGLSAA